MLYNKHDSKKNSLKIINCKKYVEIEIVDTITLVNSFLKWGCLKIQSLMRTFLILNFFEYNLVFYDRHV
jgi:hypothetical protein